MYKLFYKSPIGPLEVLVEGKQICRMVWLDQDGLHKLDFTSLKQVDPYLSTIITHALDHYFESGSLAADIPLSLQGTHFQKRVWRALRDIPSGTVRTYGEIAAELNTGSRAVGQACRRNNIPLFIPCHRVVASQGLGGFMGGYREVEKKRWLLQHERVL